MLGVARYRFGTTAAQLLLGICLALSLAACAPSFKGGPDRLFSVTEETGDMRTALQQIGGSGWYEQYAVATGPRKKELRDQIVFARMYAIDLFYSKYESQLTSERQNVGFFSTVANLALTSSATLVASAGTKTILAAAATGLTGAKEAYDKNILIERTISVLQQQMRAQRLTVKTKIIGRLGAGTDVYPLEFALGDIEDYYRAGTITGALIGAEELAGANLTAATNIEAQMISEKFAITQYGPRILAYWRANPTQMNSVNQWLAQNGIGITVATFAKTARYSDLQAQMVRDLGIP